MNSEVAVRFSLWLALGGWVGSWGFFAFVVSRIAFQVLPGDIAGDLAGMLLTKLHYAGALAAFVSAGAAYCLDRKGLPVKLAVVRGVICIASELFLSPAVAAVRPSSLGAASTVETALRFKRLHFLSLGLFMAVHAASIALLFMHARADARSLSQPT